jgi:flagellar FliJ protein
MSALKSIIFAISVACKKRDALVQMLNRYQRLYAYANDQMMQLSAYAGETNEKWRVSSQRGTSPELMRHHYQFMVRLEDAMTLQADVLKNAEVDVRNSQQKFLAAEVRIASLELMQKKMQSSIDLLKARKEQKQTDEFAATRRITIYETV